MMSRMLGACLGGTMRGAHHAFDLQGVRSLITPPNFGSGAGSCLPSMVVVASGDPGVPVICWAIAGTAMISAANNKIRNNFVFILHLSSLLQKLNLITLQPCIVLLH